MRERRTVTALRAMIGLLTIMIGLTGCGSSTTIVRRSATSRRSSRTPDRPSGTQNRPTPGAVQRVTIPAPGTGYHPRPALVYLPPGYGHERRRWPVIELLHGSSGEPTDWVTQGDAQRTLDAFAAVHHGAAPIVVMPDINGSLRGDSECVQTSDGGDVETYLAYDLPRFVHMHYAAATDRRQWSIAGLSEGGTCAVMLALRHRATFAAFGDLSGLARPTLTDQDSPAATIAGVFDGSVAAYRQHDPQWLLTQHRYPRLAGWFSCGTSETEVLDAQRELAKLSRAAGIDVHTETLPGGHEWSVWSTAFRHMLPWLWARTGY